MKIKIEVNKSKSKNNLFTAGNCHSKFGEGLERSDGDYGGLFSK